MRAWLKVLADRHPQVTWVPGSHEQVTNTTDAPVAVRNLDELARSA
jgi:hypothetical protein